MKSLLSLVLVLTSSAFADDCAISLGSPSQFVPDDADRARLVGKIMANVGEGKLIDDIDGGNNGVHAYFIPHARVERFVKITSEMHGGGDVLKLREFYDPARHIFVAIVDTEDEPVMTVVLFPRDAAEPVRRTDHRLNPTDSEDSKTLREVVPGAWDEEGYLQSAHLLWAAVLPSVEVPLPWEVDHSRWSIDAYE